MEEIIIIITQSEEILILTTWPSLSVDTLFFYRNTPESRGLATDPLWLQRMARRTV